MTGAGAVLIAWAIAGAGMLALAFVYQMLAARQPALDNGVFAYARAGGGDMAGFSAAWGYWLSAWIGNVGYLVIFFAAAGHFFPVFGEGNNAAAIVAASLLLWTLHGLVLAGVRTAALQNVTPLTNSSWDTRIENPEGLSLPESERSVHMNEVSAEYFATYGTPILAGRDFTPQDIRTAPRRRNERGAVRSTPP